MIEWLIRNLDQGKKIAVLSRGYRRKTSGFRIADQSSTALEIGDEPMQIHRKFPAITVAVDGNRRRGIRKLEDQVKPDLILLDDAFQHRKVQPTFSILLTTYDRLFTDDWFLPTGTLRDARSQAKRADIIVVTKCPQDLSDYQMHSISEKLRKSPAQDVLFCKLKYSDKVYGAFGEKSISDLSPSNTCLVTGIANPEPLRSFLSQQGIEVIHKKFADHHSFTEGELTLLKGEEFVLTTEKDFVRSLHVMDNAGYIEVRHSFLADGKEKLLNKLRSL